MTYLQAFLLALIQGLTEFLPISSSAHLILPSQILGWPDQGLAYDVSIHVGTLIAVMIYFRTEISSMSRAWYASVFKRESSQDSRLAWAVLWGTVPVGIAGLLFQGFIEHNLRTTLVIATTTLVYAPLLWWSYRVARNHTRTEHAITIKDVAVIGFSQALALIPGTSRSGVTMTAGFFMGLSPAASARFSFLLSIPVIVLAGGLEGLDLIEQTAAVAWGQIVMGVAVSCISAYLSIHFFMTLLERVGMLPFVLYRLLLGFALVALLVGV